MIFILESDHKKKDTKNKDRISKPFLSCRIKYIFYVKYKNFYMLSIKSKRKKVKQKTKILGQIEKYMLSF